MGLFHLPGSSSPHSSARGDRGSSPSPYLLPRSTALRSSHHHHGTSSASNSPSIKATAPSPRPGSSKSSSKPGSKANSRANSPYISPVISPHGTPRMIPQQATPPPPPISLNFRIESPPLLMIGSNTESTGALLSGLFTLQVIEKPVFLKSVHISIIQEVKVNIDNPNASSNSLLSSFGVPFHKYFPSPCLTCPDCLTRTTELARWDVLASPNRLPQGSHAYPFSHLIPGSVPATTTNAVFTVNYKLIAVAVPNDDESFDRLDNSKPYTLELPLNIKRAILKGPDRNSLRVFPPTEFVAHITMPNVAYPESTIPVEVVLEGISLPTASVSSATALHRKTRWRMRKVNWRIDETSCMRVARCPKHENSPLPKKSRTQSNSSDRSSVSSRKSSNNNPQTPSGMNAPSSPALIPRPVAPAHLHSNLHSPNNSMLHPGSANNSPAVQPMSPVLMPSAAHTSRTAGAPGSVALSPRINSPIGSVNNNSPLAAASSAASGSGSNAVAGGPTQNPEALSQDAAARLQEEELLKQGNRKETDIEINETRTVGAGEIKGDWKTDFSGKGKIELLAEIATHSLSRVTCNIDDPTYDMKVTHLLVLEIVVAEEVPPSKGHYQPALTGAARVLRMQFNLMITDRSGLGIAWDDEVPPKYSDVPLSPPDYDVVTSARLPKIEDFSLNGAFIDDDESLELSRGINSRLAKLKIGHCFNSSNGTTPASSVQNSPQIAPVTTSTSISSSSSSSSSSSASSISSVGHAINNTSNLHENATTARSSSSSLGTSHSVPAVQPPSGSASSNRNRNEEQNRDH